MHSQLADATDAVYWLLDRPEPLAPLTCPVAADLVIVGGGYTGLWTALLAKERDPRRDVVLLEGGVCGDGASGRNGGFVHPSLTHGVLNGYERWPDEIGEINRQGLQNVREIGETVERYGIDCDWRVPGELVVATKPHSRDDLREEFELMTRLGWPVRWLEPDEISADGGATFYGGLIETGVAMIEPARLAWGLRQACLDLGVRIFEDTTVVDVRETSSGVTVSTTSAGGKGEARGLQVVVATNAFRSPLRQLRWQVVPVYDYVLMSKPLTDEQLERIGWDDRCGMAGAETMFAYYRMTRDNRLLWGGYDAVYFFGGKYGERQAARAKTHDQLAELFAATFPALADLQWDYKWSGLIDTCTRFAPFYGTTHHGKVAYAAGFTGLGVAASRFGANVMLDVLAGDVTERTRLAMVRAKPTPFPPEPFRWIGITLTRLATFREDRTGKRGLWLRLMDRLGLGFES